MKKTQKNLDLLVEKTKLGRISLRHCRKAYELVFRERMPDDMAFVNALFLAVDEAGADKVTRIIRAVHRIDAGRHY